MTKLIRKIVTHVALFASFTFVVAAQNKTKTGENNEPETVVTAFHVKAGKQAEMSRLIKRAWKTYDRLGMVLKMPNVIVHGVDDSGRLFFMEILSWRNHDVPDNAPAEVQAIWAEMEVLCEKRDGHRGIEFHEVQITR